MKYDIAKLKTNIDRNFVHDAIVRGVLVTLMSIFVAISVSMLSIHNLPYQLQWKAVATSIAVPILVAPPAITYIVRQDFKGLLLMQEVMSLALTDEMTGLANRRSFMTEAQKRLDRHNFGKCGFAVLLLDLDHFKLVNDCHGHKAGDLALIHAAKLMASTFDKSNIPTRLGGEEFIAIMSFKDEGELHHKAEELRKAIAVNPCPIDNQNIWLTVSIGIGIAKPSDTSLSAIMCRADEALYTAKERGRNQHVLAA